MKSKSLLFLLALPLAGFIYISGPDGKKVTGVDLDAMDRNADPRKNFYQFANGSWLKNNPIPESESNWSGFNEVDERVHQVLRKIMDEALNPEVEKKTEEEQMLATFYMAAMDSMLREQHGIEALHPFFDQINDIKDASQLSRMIGELHTFGIHPFFSISVMADAMQSDVNTTYLWQDGLGMPDKSYYEATDKRTVEIRNDYQKHLQKMFELAGYENDKAVEAAKHVYGIEKQLAAKSRSQTELRDIEKMYNPHKKEQLSKLSPALDWTAYLQGAQAEIRETAIVGQPEYFEAINAVIADGKNMPAIKNYLKFHVINATATKLTTAFEEQQFKFYGTTLYGVQQQRPRWKRVVAVSNQVLGDLVGQIYVERAVTPGTKERVNQMVDDLTKAFQNRLVTLPWMTDETKKRAVGKLMAVRRKLAYPDEWKTYQGLHMEPHSYAGNFLNATRYNYLRDIAKSGQPVNKDEWGATPQTVNAYYNPLNNEIVFPAAIMQPPFFYPAADDAVNYGSMGAVIGHELTHGFDDQGCLFNAEGNMENWWAPSDQEQFKKRATALIDQYSSYKVADDLHVNGELTLGENIADLGGLSMAYDALHP